MAVPTVLNEDTVGAPALTGEDGSLYAVLKWALPQLGWSIAFDDSANSKIAFRNSPTSGTGYYLRVNDAAANHAADARRAEVSVYDSMSDIDTGTDKTPSSGEKYFVKSHTADATARDWYVIGDDTFFYLMTYNGAFSDEEGYRAFYAGDFVSNVAADTGNFILGATDSSSTIASSVSHGFPTLVGIGEVNGTELTHALAKSYDGLSSSVACRFMQALPSNTATAFAGQFGSVGAYPDPVTNNILTSVIEIFETIGAARHRRGYLKGAVAPLSALTEDDAGTHGIADRAVLQGIASPGGIGDALYLRCTNLFGGAGNSSNQYALLFPITVDWS